MIQGRIRRRDPYRREFFMRKFLFGCAVASALALSPVAAAAAGSLPGKLSASQQETYALAVESFRAHRYDAAYGRFMRLADAGHVRSAQLALVMYRNGPALFARQWDATPEQLDWWTMLVVADESEPENVALFE
jgi:hypothetical protein